MRLLCVVKVMAACTTGVTKFRAQRPRETREGREKERNIFSHPARFSRVASNSNVLLSKIVLCRLK